MHFHLGTGIRDVEIYLRALREMLLFAARLRAELDLHVSHFDLGGGFGVPTVRPYSIWDQRLMGKMASYVEQARVPLPARTETYNQLYRIGAHSVLSAELLATVDPEQPARLQKDAYEEVEAASLVDRMLGYDWRFTLTDNDLPKVSVTAALAGIGVGFPLLDDAWVDFSLRLPAEQKVRRLRLRHFFKNSLTGFLPDEGVRKKKHGIRS